jgi:hypothetical protein
MKNFYRNLLAIVLFLFLILGTTLEYSWFVESTEGVRELSLPSPKTLQASTNPYIIGSFGGFDCTTIVPSTCNETADWGGGGIAENFENSDTNFCTDDWTENDTTNTYDSNFADPTCGDTHSGSLALENGKDDRWIKGTFNSTQGLAYLCYVMEIPAIPTGTSAWGLPVAEDTGGGDIDNVMLKDIGGTEQIWLDCGVTGVERFYYTAGDTYGVEFKAQSSDIGDGYSKIRLWHWNGSSWDVVSEVAGSCVGSCDNVVTHDSCDASDSAYFRFSAAGSSGISGTPRIDLPLFMTTSCAETAGFEDPWSRSWSGFKLFMNLEETPGANYTLHPSDEFAFGATVYSIDNGLTVDSGGAIVGSRGLDVDSSNDQLFASANWHQIITGTEPFKFGFATHLVATGEDNLSFIRYYKSGGTFAVRMADADGGGPGLTGIFFDWGGSTNFCTTDYIMSTGVDYFIEVLVDMDADSHHIKIYNFTTGALLENQTCTDSLADSAFVSGDNIYIGEDYGKAADYKMDQIMVTTDTSVDLVDYRNQTVYGGF